jgi:hypothetical protein
MSGEWKSWDVGRIAVMDSLKDKPTGEVMDAVEHELRCLSVAFLQRVETELHVDRLKVALRSDVRRYEGDLRTLADE